MTIDEFIKKLEQVRPEFENEFLKRVALKTPVRTGALRDGWFWDISSGDVNHPVFSNVESYAPYVEFGTPHMAPHGMVGTTILEVADILKTAVKAAGL